MAARRTFLALTLAAAVAGPACADGATTAGPACPTDGDEVETAKLYVEYNATDDDTGVHGTVGGEAWSLLCISTPDGGLLLAVEPSGALGDLAVSDLFFESREPAADEVSQADVLAGFPAGDYTVAAVDHEGRPRVGTARFTQVIPQAPTITTPALAGDPEGVVDPVPAEGFTVAWDPVTADLTGATIAVTGYEVIVTAEEFEDPDGWSRPVFDVHVRPDVHALDVPEAFLAPDSVYEIEVLALEPSGNQTITVGFVRTGA